MLLTTESFLNVALKHTRVAFCMQMCGLVYASTLMYDCADFFFCDIYRGEFSPLLSPTHTVHIYHNTIFPVCSRGNKIESKLTLFDINHFSCKPLCTCYASPSFSGISDKEIQNFRVYLSMHMLM